MTTLFHRLRRAWILARLKLAVWDYQWALDHAPSLTVEKRKALWRAEFALNSHAAAEPVPVSWDGLVLVVSAGGALPFLISDLLEKFK